MIKPILRNILRLVFVLAIAYAGSFVVMEESFEKTEKTEKSEEALQCAHFSKHSKKDVTQGQLNTRSALVPAFDTNLKLLRETSPVLFNINHIYYTSYLDIHIS